VIPFEVGCPISITVYHLHPYDSLLIQLGSVSSKQTWEENISHCLHFFDMLHIPEPYTNYIQSTAQKNSNLFLYLPVSSAKLAADQCLLPPRMHVVKTNFHFSVSFLTLYTTIYVVQTINYFTIIPIISYELLSKFTRNANIPVALSTPSTKQMTVARNIEIREIKQRVCNNGIIEMSLGS
jgi:hypothetical protein